VRVSSKDQEKEGFSIPAQRKLWHAYAEEHGIHLVEEFEDVEAAKESGRGGEELHRQSVRRSAQGHAREKAEQGHWPSVAHIGYVNNRDVRRTDVDRDRGPLIAPLFAWYARGNVSLKELPPLAMSSGLTHPRRA